MRLPVLLAVLAATAQVPPTVDGDWSGRIGIPAGAGLPIVLHVHGGAATLDSPAQGATGLAATVTPTADGVVVALAAPPARLTVKLSTDGQALDGTWAQGGGEAQAHLVRVQPGGAAPRPPPAPARPQTPKAPFPYASEEVRFPGGAAGIMLAGTLTRPPGPGRFPAVVLVAGSGPQNRDEVVFGHRVFAVLADRLTREGLIVLRYDKRGVGASSPAPSQPAVPDYAADARAAFAFLRTRPDVKRDRIGLLGHSEGGESAPLAAEGGGVAFLVLLAAPALRGDEMLASQFRAISLASGATAAQAEAAASLERRTLRAAADAPDPATAKARVTALLAAEHMTQAQAENAASQVASPWLLDFARRDPGPQLRALRVPVLAIYGGKDVQVPPADNAPAMRSALAADRRAEVIELAGLNHLLQPATTGLPNEYAQTALTIDPKALDLIAGWTAKAAGVRGR